MEEIIKAFGIDGRLIVIQIVNFTILMSILGYFLYTPILNLLRNVKRKLPKVSKMPKQRLRPKLKRMLRSKQFSLLLTTKRVTSTHVPK